MFSGDNVNALANSRVQNFKKRFLSTTSLSIIVLPLAIGLSMPSIAHAQSTGPTFQCDGTAYTLRGNRSRIETLDPITLVLGAQGRVNPRQGVNGVGLNALDGYMYGISTANNSIVRIDASANAENLGIPTGTGVFNPRFQAGVMDTVGNFYGINGSQVFTVPIHG